MKVNIYALIDPITCKVRYIGRTRNSLKTRLNGHYSKCTKRNNHKECWIYSLRAKGLKPKIRLLCIKEGWEESHIYERSCIKRAIAFGFNLVNNDDRGAGGVNKIITYKQKKQISNTLKKGYAEGRIKFTNTCPVIVYDLLGNKLYRFETQKACAEKLNIHVSTIETQISGKIRRCGKYQIRSEKQDNPGTYLLTRDNSNLHKAVIITDVETNISLNFESYKATAKYLNVSSTTIKRKIESGKLLKNKYSICLNNKKSDKLLETPEEDNQQPIISLND